MTVENLPRNTRGLASVGKEGNGDVLKNSGGENPGGISAPTTLNPRLTALHNYSVRKALLLKYKSSRGIDTSNNVLLRLVKPLDFTTVTDITDDDPRP